MLMCKLLFEQKPKIDSDKIFLELQIKYKNVVNNSSEDTIMFAFPDFEIVLKDAKFPAQSIVAFTNENLPLALPEEAFRQNWHWKEANDESKKCNFEVMVSDFMSSTLDYKQRLPLYIDFLEAVVKVMKPKIIYSVYGQKLLKTSDFLYELKHGGFHVLEAICNVRMFNITGSKEQEIIMDTTGLNAIGLPELQIQFDKFDPSKIANLLWTYAYYLYENGDVLEDGNTIEGIQEGSKWICRRGYSLIDENISVINIVTS